MKSYIFMLIAAAVFFPSSVLAEEYIVKPKDNSVMLLDADRERCIPELGLYILNDTEGLDPDMYEFIEKDADVELFGSYDYSSVICDVPHSLTGIKRVWDMGVYGSDVVIGVVDSGCNEHSALQGNLLPGVSVVEGIADTKDNIGHGTAVCGIAAAKYGTGEVIGSAHKAKILPVKFTDRDENGQNVGGKVSDLVSGIVAAVDNGCDIINMSCGTVHSGALKEAIDYAYEKGVVMTAAVGNDSSEALRYPAAYDEVIGVGSVGEDKVHSPFSNHNDSVFIAAPGEDIPILKETESFGRDRGTSFSAPYAAGVIADMLSIDRDLDAGTIKEILASTAEDLGEAGYDTYYGHGLIRADSIVSYMTSGSDCFVSAEDVCSEDGLTERRFSFAEGKTGQCMAAEIAENGRFISIETEMESVGDNVFAVRVQKSDDAKIRWLVWESFESMIPVKLNTADGGAEIYP